MYTYYSNSDLDKVQAKVFQNGYNWFIYTNKFLFLSVETHAQPLPIMNKLITLTIFLKSYSNYYLY